MAQPAFSKHRVEALTDGIFAVAMTLLVIELKLPHLDNLISKGEFIEAVASLVPKFQSWVISFFVLAIFWYTHHRQFHYVRVVDGKLLWLNILYLSFVSLMPFSSALAGEYSRMLFAQIVYSANMTLLAIGGLLNNHYVFHHHELGSEPITRGFYRGSHAVGISMVIPGAGNAAFMLMIPISIISKRLEVPNVSRKSQ